MASKWPGFGPPSTVSGLLANAELTAAPAGLRPKALVAPHAGYAFSGAVAAAAFATLMAGTAQAIRRAVVIGPSHHAAFRGIAAPTAEAFATPLGRVPMDRDALSDLAGQRLVALDDGPHAPEGSVATFAVGGKPPARWLRLRHITQHPRTARR